MPDIITLTDPRSPVSEAYRSLRANLAFARPDEPLHTLLVTSPAPDADKAEVAANLAVVSAQADQRVILVDADLRRPAQHERFGLENTRGLTDALVADLPGGPPLQPTAVPGLFILTSGPLPPNPAELLASRRMRALLTDLAARADLVIIDAPPLVAVSDAAVLAQQVDGVLLVLAAGRSRRDHAVQAKETLAKVGATLLGVVLTEVEPDSAAYGAYR
ncbi:MAG: CpsD/CapB family tyrosine-protein kinase [Anaerolineae bacterium]|jgi:non-specific protein-tyrosine kinase|nr:CpsD/CapB family tyrosine-protein kinase [Ardenticatenia bacterium]HQZ69721.1 CpsD/CapB family tyrosine-protein kinase [Anaerolineae bacterium]HRA19250.1 CpsD/CapB family tyrosine-protein kinase [Anaerolineae bacterium]